MTAKLFVFTATGNSLWAARTLAEKLGDCEIVPIVPALRSGLINPGAERVGFVFPLYFLGLPLVVSRFIRSLDLSAAKFVFALVTKGFPMMAGAAGDYRRSTGNRLDRLDYVRMPDNYLPNFDAPSQAEFDQITAKAGLKLARIAEGILAGRKGIERSATDLIGSAYHKPFLSKLAGSQPLLTVGDSCNGCGICAKTCPVGNIRMDGKRPVYGSECEMCLACAHVCPTEAIQMGPKTVGRKRYVNTLVGWKGVREFNATK